MELLRFFADLRTPIGDAFFSTITRLGEETFFIVFGLIFFWCISKKQGYYLLIIGFTGTILNQFLKLWFRIPRPWVLDPEFQPIESAIEEASGYSFPSGHTQASVGLFGAIARYNKGRLLRTICIAICVLVPISRMYLGVHTFLDVSVSMVIALAMVFGIYPLITKAKDETKVMRILFGIMLVLAIAYVVFIECYNFPADIDAHNFTSGSKTAYQMLGCTLGIWIAYEIDIRFVNFDTKATIPAQILKVLAGLVPVLLIKEGMRAPLALIFGEGYLKDGVRYLLIVLFAGCIWPMTFKWFGKLFQKK